MNVFATYWDITQRVQPLHSAFTFHPQEVETLLYLMRSSLGSKDSSLWEHTWRFPNPGHGGQEAFLEAVVPAEILAGLRLRIYALVNSKGHTLLADLLAVSVFWMQNCIFRIIACSWLASLNVDRALLICMTYIFPKFGRMKSWSIW